MNSKEGDAKETSNHELLGGPMVKCNERPHKKLILWQKAMDLVTAVYSSTKEFPPQEMYGLIAQLRRAAVSVPSNIAEGLTRRSKADKLLFLNISQSSLSEIDTQMEISTRLDYLNESTYDDNVTSLIDVQRLLGGLIRSIRSRGAIS